MSRYYMAIGTIKPNDVITPIYFKSTLINCLLNLDNLREGIGERPLRIS